MIFYGPVGLTRNGFLDIIASRRYVLAVRWYVYYRQKSCRYPTKMILRIIQTSGTARLWRINGKPIVKALCHMLTPSPESPCEKLRSIRQQISAFAKSSWRQARLKYMKSLGSFRESQELIICHSKAHRSLIRQGLRNRCCGGKYDIRTTCPSFGHEQEKLALLGMSRMNGSYGR